MDSLRNTREVFIIVTAVLLATEINCVKKVSTPLNELKFKITKCGRGYTAPFYSIRGTVLAKSKADCARVCSRQKECFSFNYKKKAINDTLPNCELTAWRLSDCSKMEKLDTWTSYLVESPCKNYGKLDIINGVKICKCIGVWIGKHCEVKAKDCRSYIDQKAIDDGFHQVIIQPTTSPRPFTVRCTFSKNTAYYILAQRVYDKENIPNFFNRTWKEYKYGFRANNVVFWIGNEQMHHITHPKSRYHSLCFYFVLRNGTRYCTFFSGFSVSSEAQGYALSYDKVVTTVVTTSCIVNKYDVLNPDNQAELSLKGMQFSTYDRDNDASKSNCAKNFGGGWWYRNCSAFGLTVGSMADIFWMDQFNNTNNTGPTRIDKIFINLWEGK